MRKKGEKKSGVRAQSAIPPDKKQSFHDWVAKVKPPVTQAMEP
jgi:hypothetical protein